MADRLTGLLALEDRDDLLHETGLLASEPLELALVEPRPAAVVAALDLQPLEADGLELHAALGAVHEVQRLELGELGLLEGPRLLQGELPALLGVLAGEELVLGLTGLLERHERSSLAALTVSCRRRGDRASARAGRWSACRAACPRAAARRA